MKKNVIIAVLLLIIAVLIAVIPLATNHESEFGGADGQAADTIAELDPDYEPWAESILEPPGGETESLLFCLQAALGAGVFGYGFGYLVSRKKYAKGAEQ